MLVGQISWESDYSDTTSGWKLCLGSASSTTTIARRRRTHAYSVQAGFQSGRRTLVPLAATHFDKTTAQGQILRNSTMRSLAELAQQSAEEIAFRSISEVIGSEHTVILEFEVSRCSCLPLLCSRSPCLLPLPICDLELVVA